MELDGAKRCFQFIKDAGLKVTSFISDRHKGIAKWIRESQPTMICGMSAKVSRRKS